MTNIYLALNQDMDYNHIIGAFNSLIAAMNAVMEVVRQEIKIVKDVYLEDDLKAYGMTWNDILMNRAVYTVREIEINKIEECGTIWKLDYEVDSECKIKKFDWVTV